MSSTPNAPVVEEQPLPLRTPRGESVGEVTGEEVSVEVGHAELIVRLR